MRLQSKEFAEEIVYSKTSPLDCAINRQVFSNICLHMFCIKVTVKTSTTYCMDKSVYSILQPSTGSGKLVLERLPAVSSIEPVYRAAEAIITIAIWVIHK